MKEYLARARTVTAPDDRRWTVRRVILPRIPHFDGFGRGRSARDGPGPDPWWSGLDPIGVFDAWPGLFVVVLVIAVLAAIVFFVLPLLIFVLDVALVLALAALGIVARVLFRRPWKIVAATDAGIGEAHAWAVVGTRASAYAVDAVARQLLTETSPTAIYVGQPIAP